jgi:hypothetical protein
MRTKFRRDQLSIIDLLLRVVNFWATPTPTSWATLSALSAAADVRCDRCRGGIYTIDADHFVYLLSFVLQMIR